MVGAPISISSENNTRFDDLLWDRAAGKVQCDRPYRFDIATPPSLGNDICTRCRAVHNLSPPQTITIASELVEIVVSVLAEDEHSFITGFKLVYGKISPGMLLAIKFLKSRSKLIFAVNRW
ncbi:uncharacterized protein N7479_005030 [Penicillium vulpinum]|uniref:Uncharacterized protein n=1 Tax=Penicillium vulpinum TaxID=29845 RepID=A0A1V6RME4_9EURO|nr:uncharacterized protein N7479_005030 [Penicillium vulpinum]KAJ5965154.1 hypothetical protein N7479_005030 [Penicillium vulpinum]OQE02955.1 hypothetical protein PENVUL_c036G05734 [Penicillium vulpinum]